MSELTDFQGRHEQTSLAISLTHYMAEYRINDSSAASRYLEKLYSFDHTTEDLVRECSSVEFIQLPTGEKQIIFQGKAEIIRKLQSRINSLTAGRTIGFECPGDLTAKASQRVQEHWHLRRQRNLLVGAAFIAQQSFFNDPIEEMMEQGLMSLTEFQKQEIASSVAWFQRLWTVIQYGYKYLRQDARLYMEPLAAQEFCNLSALEIFCSVIRDLENSGFKVFSLPYYHYSAPKMKKAWYEAFIVFSNPKSVMDLKAGKVKGKKSKSELNQFNQNPEPKLFRVVYLVCKHYAAKDQKLADAVQDFRQKTSQRCDLEGRRYTSRPLQRETGYPVSLTVVKGEIKS